jgi:hypothetical protein
MKENLKTAMVALAVLFSAGAFAQTGSVGINTTTPDPSAVLDVVSTTKGILPPRMTNDQMKAIANPTEGLTAYNTTLKCLVTYINGSFSCSYNAPAQKAPTAPVGSTYTAHYNGITSGASINNTLSTYNSGEKFSDNTTCATKEISAQGCGGLSTVTGASGRVYNLVNINGQCWFKENLNEVPSNFRSYTPTSWLNTTKDTGDITTLPMPQGQVVGVLANQRQTKVCFTNGMLLWTTQYLSAAVGYALPVSIYRAIVSGCT